MSKRSTQGAYNSKHIMAAGAMLGLIWALGYTVEQSEFFELMSYYVPLFGLYLWFYREAKEERIDMVWVLRLALLLRVVLLFEVPLLSNDFYRFIWDGRLLLAGYSPFSHLPSEILSMQPVPAGIDRALFEAFGAKDTYSTYPPVLQLQFLSAVWAFPDSVKGAAFVLKLWQVGFEAGTLWLLPRMLRGLGLPPFWAVWYALNPLVIVEISGNAHSEGAMVFFLLFSLWLLMNEKWLASSMALALSICSKLLPAMFLPFIFKRLGWRRGVRYIGMVGLFTVLFFLLFIDLDAIGNFGGSLGLYFQKLEFNGSIYYLLRWIGWQVKGYNMISVLGPALGAVAGVVILWLAWRWLPASPLIVDLKLLEAFFWAICIYLFLTTTLHPWYLTLPIVLCVFTLWRFPILWSLLIFMTYYNYSHTPWHESTLVLWIEYGGVGAFILLECLFLQRFLRSQVSPGSDQR